MSNFISTKTPC